MLIPDHLPQFVDKKTLVLVAGTQSADIHMAHESEIETIAEVRIKNIEHDDQPSQFQRRSHGKTLGSGGSEDDEAVKLKKQFHAELSSALEEINLDTVDQVVLFSSPQDKPATKEQLPKQLVDKIELEIDGNFVGEHPKDIIERVVKADKK